MFSLLLLVKNSRYCPKVIEQFSKLEMSDQQNLPIKEEKKEAAVEAEGQKKLKPCCACPETKRARDQCVNIKDKGIYFQEFLHSHWYFIWNSSLEEHCFNLV
uniref:Uncharacterized protein n=1 Tax=Daphnia galeata TaxID=27404 RepID=A0A8J2WHN4_9CRUS|nr:unnamed protein product [Daphnia galeata]